MSRKKILIVAGEPSGDLHASNLVKDLKQFDPDLEFFGLGGNLSKEAGVEVIFDISKLALVGLVEVLKNIFTVKDAFKAVLAKIDAEHPDLAILVDYPGFNLRLAMQLKKRSIPVVYYISPQVWAWGRDRVNIIKSCVEKILVFFKFEEELYKTYDIDAEFVGHPLVDTVKVTLKKDEVFRQYGLSKDQNVTVALLPGSRRLEVEAFLRTMLFASRMIDEKMGGAQFIIVKHPGLGASVYEKAIKEASVDVKIAEGDTYNVVAACDFAIVASGTATLETAIVGTPMAIVYKANFITYILYKFVSTIGFLGLVNIIAGKEVAPELLQLDFTPQDIADAVVGILKDKKRISSIREELKQVTSSLGKGGASMRAAKAVYKLLG